MPEILTNESIAPYLTWFLGLIMLLILWKRMVEPQQRRLDVSIKAFEAMFNNNEQMLRQNAEHHAQQTKLLMQMSEHQIETLGAITQAMEAVANHMRESMNNQTAALQNMAKCPTNQGAD